MKVSLVLAGFAALLMAPAGLASVSYAKVVSPGGRVLAVGSGSMFAYPSDGSLVQVGNAITSDGAASLSNVQLLGGLVDVGDVEVFGNGQVSLGSIAAAGRVIDSRPNELVPLGNLGYLMIDQTAVSGGNVGRVALRLVVQSPGTGVPVGTEILIGIPVRPGGPGSRARRGAAGSVDPLAVLGLSGGIPGDPFVPPPVLGQGSVGEQAVAIAEQYLGVPYVWGGASPLTGFDCSGLAMYVYAQLGITLTHYTGAQYFEGTPIPLADLAPGDLLFFDPTATRGPQHEGIYIGGGRFIQAPHTGDVVKISSLADPAYGFSFVGAVRPS